MSLRLSERDKDQLERRLGATFLDHTDVAAALEQFAPVNTMDGGGAAKTRGKKSSSARPFFLVLPTFPTTFPTSTGEASSHDMSKILRSVDAPQKDLGERPPQKDLGDPLIGDPHEVISAKDDAAFAACCLFGTTTSSKTSGGPSATTDGGASIDGATATTTVNGGPPSTTSPLLQLVPESWLRHCLREDKWTPCDGKLSYGQIGTEHQRIWAQEARKQPNLLSELYDVCYIFPLSDVAEYRNTKHTRVTVSLLAKAAGINRVVLSWPRNLEWVGCGNRLIRERRVGAVWEQADPGAELEGNRLIRGRGDRSWKGWSM